MTAASDDENFSSIRDVYAHEHQSVRSHLKLALRGNASLAEDLTHEVFLELWRLHGDALSAMSHTHVRAKLFMTANSRVIDMYRRNRKEITVPDPTHETVQAAARPPAAPDPSERVLAVDTLERFWRVLREGLTDREFQVAYQLRDAARKKDRGAGQPRPAPHRLQR